MPFKGRQRIWHLGRASWRTSSVTNFQRSESNTAGPGIHIDGGGLELRVRATGAKSWVLRVTKNGKRRNVGIGPYPTIGLAEARRRAERVRRGEPIEEGSDG